MFENIPQSYAEIRDEEMRLQEAMAAEEELRLQEAMAAGDKETLQESELDALEPSISGQPELEKGTDLNEGLSTGKPETEPVELGRGKGSDTGVIVATATVTGLVALTVLYLLLRRRGRNEQKKD